MNAVDALVEVAAELMFPEPQDRPPSTPVEARHPQITSAVASDLRLPELDMRFRPTTVETAAMPKARVDEDKDLEAGEDKIGGTMHSDVLAVPQPRAPQRAPQQQLDPTVSLLDAGHDPTACFLTNGIHFGSTSGSPLASFLFDLEGLRPPTLESGTISSVSFARRYQIWGRAADADSR